MENRPDMFCYQCQETSRGKGCEKIGVCGKQSHTSARMDLLLYAVRGVAALNRALRLSTLCSLPLPTPISMTLRWMISSAALSI